MSERKRKINLFLHSIEYLIAFCIFFLFGIIHTLALETKTIYSVNNNGTLASANTYNYGYLTGGGTQSTARANVNTTISGKAYGFMFLFYENVVLNKTYTLVVNFMDVDLLKTFNSSMVRVSTCNGDTCNDNTIVSVVKSNNYGNSNKLTIEFNPITIGSVVLVNLGSNEAITGISTFGIKSVTLDSTNQSQDIINNQTNNTNNIINNNNSNTQEIIENQNSNASAIQDTINSNFQDCHTSVNLLNLPNGSVTNRGITGTITNGNVLEFSGTATTVYADITSNASVTLSAGTYTFSIDKELTNRVVLYASGDNYSSNIIINAGTKSTTRTFTSDITVYRVGISGLTSGSTYNSTIKMQLQEGSTATDYEPYGQKICTNKLDEQTNAINNLNDSINDDDIGGATQDGADFILDFDTNTFGLTSIITAPLNLIESLTSSTCSELELPLPFLNNKKLKLPCMTTIYQNTFGSLFTMYQTITFGIIAYWVCVRIFNQVKDFKNPEHDEIEVVDL